MIFNQISILMFGASGLSLFLSVYTWKRRQNHPAVTSLAILFVAMSIWNFFYAMELVSTDLPHMKIFSWFAYIGIVTLPVLAFIFAVRYAAKDAWLTPLTITLLFIVPVFTLSILLTNDLHHLFYSSVELNRVGAVHYQKTTAGPFWWIHVIYSYLAIISGLFIFIRMLFAVPKGSRSRIIVFIIGYLLPFAVSIAYTNFLHSMGFFDPTPLAFICTGCILLAGIFSNRFINIIPVALDTLFTANPDGIIVLNRNAELITANHAAKAVLSSMKCRVAEEPIKTESLFDFNELTACQSNSKDIAVGDKVFSCISTGMANSIGYLITMHDITERRRAEDERKNLQDQLSQAQKAESLGRMAGAVAHHFNNQLSVVMGNLELVLLDPPADAKNRKSLLQAMKAAQKAADVSRQILYYLGPITGTHTPVNLSDVCRQSMALLQSALPSGMTLNVDLPDSGPIVHADAGQIQQVLTNLFNNARESMVDDQGRIGLCISTVSHEDIPESNRFPLDWQPQDIAYACLEVSDTGCGISREDIGKIIDPFFSTKFTGRGMGLSVTLGLLKSHKSCITVASEPNKGTVFRVYLPISTEKNR